MQDPDPEDLDLAHAAEQWQPPVDEAPIAAKDLAASARRLLAAMQLAAKAGCLDELVLVELKYLLIDSARINRRRGAWIRLHVPDECVAALRGPEEAAPAVYALLAVPAPFFKQASGESVIVSPTGRPVAAGG